VDEQGLAVDKVGETDADSTPNDFAIRTGNFWGVIPGDDMKGGKGSVDSFILSGDE
jgi:hypothetical protein